MTTYQLLQMLPERREAGRGVEELIEEIGPDVAWVKRTTRWVNSRINPLPNGPWLTWRNDRNGIITFTSPNDTRNFRIGMSVVPVISDENMPPGRAVTVSNVDSIRGIVTLEWRDE